MVSSTEQAIQVLQEATDSCWSNLSSQFSIYQIIHLERIVAQMKVQYHLIDATNRLKAGKPVSPDVSITITIEETMSLTRGILAGDPNRVRDISFRKQRLRVLNSQALVFLGVSGYAYNKIFRDLNETEFAYLLEKIEKFLDDCQDAQQSLARDDVAEIVKRIARKRDTFEDKGAWDRFLQGRLMTSSLLLCCWSCS